MSYIYHLFILELFKQVGKLVHFISIILPIAILKCFFTIFKKVVLPVPALPVRKMLCSVCSTNSQASFSSVFSSIVFCCHQRLLTVNSDNAKVQKNNDVCQSVAYLSFNRALTPCCAAFSKETMLITCN